MTTEITRNLGRLISTDPNEERFLNVKGQSIDTYTGIMVKKFELLLAEQSKEDLFDHEKMKGLLKKALEDNRDQMEGLIRFIPETRQYEGNVQAPVISAFYKLVSELRAT